MRSDETQRHQSAIYNAAWMVRNYERGGRTSIARAQREQAILMMGLAVREAFNSTDDFYPLLVAIVDGLVPREEQRF